MSLGNINVKGISNLNIPTRDFFNAQRRIVNLCKNTPDNHECTISASDLQSRIMYGRKHGLRVDTTIKNIHPKDFSSEIDRKLMITREDVTIEDVELEKSFIDQLMQTFVSREFIYGGSPYLPLKYNNIHNFLENDERIIVHKSELKHLIKITNRRLCKPWVKGIGKLSLRQLKAQPDIPFAKLAVTKREKSINAFAHCQRGIHLTIDTLREFMD